MSAAASMARRRGQLPSSGTNVGRKFVWGASFRLRKLSGATCLLRRPKSLPSTPKAASATPFAGIDALLGAWAVKAPATRNDWWRGWKRIKPIFADVDPSTVTPEMMGEWYEAIRKAAGLSEAHRALKIWRALWKVMAAFRLCEKHQDPSLTIRNRAPKGRNAIFTEGQVVRLVKRAWRMNHKGLACIMASAWDTAFSPVDCRTVASTQWFADRTGSFFVKYRQKVEAADENAVEAIGTLSRRTERLIETYLAELGTELLPDAPIFRNQSGHRLLEGRSLPILPQSAEGRVPRRHAEADGFSKVRLARGTGGRCQSSRARHQACQLDQSVEAPTGHLFAQACGHGKARRRSPKARSAEACVRNARRTKS